MEDIHVDMQKQDETVHAISAKPHSFETDTTLE